MSMNRPKKIMTQTNQSDESPVKGYQQGGKHRFSLMKWAFEISQTASQSNANVMALAKKRWLNRSRCTVHWQIGAPIVCQGGRLPGKAG